MSSKICCFLLFPVFQRVRGDVHDTQEKKGRKQRKKEQNSSPGFEKGINCFFLAGFPTVKNPAFMLILAQH